MWKKFRTTSENVFLNFVIPTKGSSEKFYALNKMGRKIKKPPDKAKETPTSPSRIRHHLSSYQRKSSSPNDWVRRFRHACQAGSSLEGTLWEKSPAQIRSYFSNPCSSLFSPFMVEPGFDRVGQGPRPSPKAVTMQCLFPFLRGNKNNPVPHPTPVNFLPARSSFRSHPLILSFERASLSNLPLQVALILCQEEGPVLSKPTYSNTGTSTSLQSYLHFLPSLYPYIAFILCQEEGPVLSKTIYSNTGTSTSLQLHLQPTSLSLPPLFSRSLPSPLLFLCFLGQKARSLQTNSLEHGISPSLQSLAAFTVTLLPPSPPLHRFLNPGLSPALDSFFVC
jgi:hypothetical protein